ncbi:MAG TPA: hypothetical protein VG435_13360 [Acidimicrobiales bacterium]|jgi:hypothetical protein|nr:hypothetical protein [Acidimicrobiales bacterium]
MTVSNDTWPAILDADEVRIEVDDLLFPVESTVIEGDDGGHLVQLKPGVLDDLAVTFVPRRQLDLIRRLVDRATDEQWAAAGAVLDLIPERAVNVEIAEIRAEVARLKGLVEERLAED